MDATTRFDTQRVGALPVIAAYLEKLRLRETIDEVGQGFFNFCFIDVAVFASVQHGVFSSDC